MPRIVDYNQNIIWTNEQGQSHREGAPAIEHSNGNKQWYINGKLHREDGPAVENNDGCKLWYINDLLHRTDGPAIESPAGKSWWINGVRYSQKEYELIYCPKNKLRRLKCLKK
jgi:hypothetical protein